jgi:hypothetical protein
MKKPSKAGKVAHDLGLSTWFGGTLFGQLSLNPAVSSIGDQRERGRVLSEAGRASKRRTSQPCSRRCSDGGSAA